jgi:chitinase
LIFLRNGITFDFQEIYSEFKRQDPKMELGVAISGYKEVLDVAYDLMSLASSVDFLSAMTYDYHGGWEPFTAHGSPLFARPGDKHPQYTADYAIKHVLSKGVPPEKLLLGLAFYGQSYQLGDNNTPGMNGPGTTAVGPGTPGDSTRQPGMLAYYEICNRGCFIEYIAIRK